MNKPRIILSICFIIAPLCAWPSPSDGQLEKGVKAFSEQRYRQAYEHWLPLADEGHAEAQLFMAVLYRYGLGTEKDLTNAASWYEKAALQGNVDAQNEIGFFYELGLGVKQDIWAAEEWYEMVRAQDYCLTDTQGTGRLMYRP